MTSVSPSLKTKVQGFGAKKMCGGPHLGHRGDADKYASAFPVIDPGRPCEKPLQVLSNTRLGLVGLCVPALALKCFGLHKMYPS